MSSPRAFISFDFDNDVTLKHLFAGQAKNSRTPFSIEDWSSKKHLPQNQWEAIIATKIAFCDMLVVLVGKKTHTAIGVKKEIGFARKNKVPVWGVYADGAGVNTTLPEGLSRSNTVAWDWEKIANMIDKNK